MTCVGGLRYESMNTTMIVLIKIIILMSRWPAALPNIPSSQAVIVVWTSLQYTNHYIAAAIPRYGQSPVHKPLYSSSYTKVWAVSSTQTIIQQQLYQGIGSLQYTNYYTAAAIYQGMGSLQTIIQLVITLSLSWIRMMAGYSKLIHRAGYIDTPLV